MPCFSVPSLLEMIGRLAHGQLEIKHYRLTGGNPFYIPADIPDPWRAATWGYRLLN